MGEGGAERAAHNLSNYLISEGNRVTFVFLKNYIIYPIHKDVEVLYLNEDFSTDRRLRTLFFYVPLKKIIKKYDAASTCVIAFNNVSSFLVGHFKKNNPAYTCIVSIQCSFTYFTTSWLKRRIIRPLMLYAYSQYDHILVVSANIKNETTQFSFKDKVNVVVNPVDIKTIQQKSQELVALKDNAHFKFINVGRFHPQKNQAILIKAFALLNRRDISLYMVGQGQLEMELLNLCKALGIEKQVHFVGLQLNPFQYLEQADCFLMSSDFEGFPNVLVEAMACGLPVISTDCPTGPREILSPKTLTTNSALKEGAVEYAEYGILVPTNDAVALSKAMFEVLNHAGIKEKYADKAFVRAQDFDVHRVFKNIEQLVQTTHAERQS